VAVRVSSRRRCRRRRLELACSTNHAADAVASGSGSDSRWTTWTQTGPAISRSGEGGPAGRRAQRARAAAYGGRWCSRA
jgi:hypothetical protein